MGAECAPDPGSAVVASFQFAWKQRLMPAVALSFLAASAAFWGTHRAGERDGCCWRDSG